MSTQMAEAIQSFVLQSAKTVLGQHRVQWMQEQAVRLVGQHSAMWWVGAWGVTFLVTLITLRRLLRRKKYRVPRPNKTVAEGEPEVLIVGSGIVGSALAAVLGRDGRKVTIIERDLSEPDRIVGEFMQPGGVVALKKLHLEECLEGIDSPHFRGYIIHDMDYTKRTLRLPLPEQYVGGRGFHHGRFVQTLRKAAMAEDKVTYIEGVVLEILNEDGVTVGVRYRPKDAEEAKVLKAPLVVVADGIYSKFRQGLTKDPPVPQGAFCGVMMHNAKQGLYRHLELVLAEPSFVINYQVSTTCTRALVDLPTYYAPMPTDIKAYLKDVVYPRMPDNLAPAFLEAVEAGRYRNQQLNFLPANPVIKPGVILLGDALNVRHALTAGGMTAGLSDVVLVREMLRKVSDFFDYSAIMNLYQQFTVDRKKTTFSLNVFAFSLYHLYASPDYHVKKIKRGMFEYFDRKGFCQEGAAGILSVLQPQPRLLLMHFLLSLLYAIVLNFKDEGVLRFPLAVYQAVVMFTKGSRIMAPYIWGEIKPMLV